MTSVHLGVESFHDLSSLTRAVTVQLGYETTYTWEEVLKVPGLPEPQIRRRLTLSIANSPQLSAWPSWRQTKVGKELHSDI